MKNTYKRARGKWDFDTHRGHCHSEEGECIWTHRIHSFSH